MMNSSPARGGEAHQGWFKEKTRVRVRAYDEAGLTQREIVKKLQEERGISVNQSTISRWIKTKQNRATKPSGRPSMLIERTVRYVTRLVRQGWVGRRMTFARIVKQLQLKVSRWTLGRALQKLGYRRCIACRRPFTNSKQQEKRIRWCTFMSKCTVNFWAKVIWSDECSFVTGERGRLYVTRRVHEKFHPSCLQSIYRSGRTSFMVWGAIGWGWKSKLVFLERRHGKRGIDSYDYAEQILEESTQSPQS